MRLSIKYKLLISIFLIILIAITINTYLILNQNKVFFSKYITNSFNNKMKGYEQKRNGFIDIINENHREHYRIFKDNLKLDLKSFINSIKYDIISEAKLSQAEKVLGLLDKLGKESYIFVLSGGKVIISSEKKFWNTNIQELKTNLSFIDIKFNTYIGEDGFRIKDRKDYLYIKKDEIINNSKYTFLVIVSKTLINRVVASQRQKVMDLMAADINKDKIELDKDKKDLNVHIKNVSLKSLVITVVFIFLVGIITIFLSIIITKKIEVIKNGITIIGEGNLKYQVNLKSFIKDELDDFTEEFNKLTAKLEDIKLSETKSIIEKILPSKSLTKNELEILSTNISSKDIGGDFYDYIFLEDSSKSIFVLGDVVGKSVPAAFLMGLTMASIRSILFSKIDTYDMLLELNDILRSMTESGKWVTLQLVEIDLPSYNVRIYNCGHPPLLYFDGNAVNEFHSESPVIGQLSRKEFSSYKFTHSIKFKRDDLILMYSDGIPESKNSENNFFGIDKVKEIIIAGREDINKRLINSLTNFTGSSSFKDDVTIMSIMRMGNNYSGRYND